MKMPTLLLMAAAALLITPALAGTRENYPIIPQADFAPSAYCTSTAQRVLPNHKVRTVCLEWALYCGPTRDFITLPGSGIVVCHPGVFGN